MVRLPLVRHRLPPAAFVPRRVLALAAATVLAGGGMLGLTGCTHHGSARACASSDTYQEFTGGRGDGHLVLARGFGSSTSHGSTSHSSSHSYHNYSRSRSGSYDDDDSGGGSYHNYSRHRYSGGYHHYYNHDNDDYYSCSPSPRYR